MILLGEIITYTIEVRNTGNVDLHKVIVTRPHLRLTIESLVGVRIFIKVQNNPIDQQWSR
jgi:hypothetical protein